MSAAATDGPRALTEEELAARAARLGAPTSGGATIAGYRDWHPAREDVGGVRSFQALDDRALAQMVERGFAEEADEGFVLVTTCASCKTKVRLPTPREEVSLAAVRLLPRFCAGCIARLNDEDERKERSARITERLRASRLPGEFHGLRFGDMAKAAGARQAPAITRAEAWALAHNPTGLLLWGPMGTGKTRLAATACFARLERYAIRWVSVAVLMSQLQAAFSDSGRKDALSVLEGTGALVLDDFDKVNPSEWGKTQLFAAIDARVSAGAPLLVTTNLPLDRESGYRGETLLDRFGGAIVSRLAGHCMGSVFEMDGPDRRITLAEEEPSWAEVGI